MFESELALKVGVDDLVWTKVAPAPHRRRSRMPQLHDGAELPEGEEHRET